jgi:hypothetical protein
MTISALVEHQFGRSPLVIRHKRYLRVHDFRKKIMVALREYFNLALSSRLCHEVIAIPRDRQDEIRGELIPAYVGVEYLWVDRYLLTLRRKNHCAAMRQGPKILCNLFWRSPVHVPEYDHGEIVHRVVG